MTCNTQRCFRAIVLVEEVLDIWAGDYSGALVMEKGGGVALEDADVEVAVETFEGDAGKETA